MYTSNIQNNQQPIDIQKLTLKINNFHLQSSFLTLKQIKWIIKQSSKLLKQSPTVLYLSLPVKIIGDIHAHYQQLIHIFETIGHPSHKNYLFLGNYPTKGSHSIQTIITLLFFKLKYPETFFLLRGRFQVAENNFMFGFYEQCTTKYNKDLWMEFNELFTFLPLAAVIDKQIYCASSGITPDIKTIDQLNNIYRNSQMTEIPQILSMLNSRPKQYHHRKSTFNQQQQFSVDSLIEWMKVNNFSLMVRSNQVLQEGFQFSFKNLVLTVCSVPNFMNVGNLGAVVNINEDCVLSLQILKSNK